MLEYYHTLIQLFLARMFSIGQMQT